MEPPLPSVVPKLEEEILRNANCTRTSSVQSEIDAIQTSIASGDFSRAGELGDLARKLDEAREKEKEVQERRDAAAAAAANAAAVKKKQQQQHLSETKAKSAEALKVSGKG
jgi:hypothetical protein